MVNDLARGMKQRGDRYNREFKGVIPAAPGWELVEVYDSADNAEVFSTPIVAWELLNTYGISTMRPIAVETFNEPYYVKTPDGRVFTPEDCAWDTVEQFRLSMIKLRRGATSGG